MQNIQDIERIHHMASMLAQSTGMVLDANKQMGSMSQKIGELTKAGEERDKQLTSLAEQVAKFNVELKGQVDEMKDALDASTPAEDVQAGTE